MLKKYYIDDLRAGEKQYKEYIMGPVWFAAMKDMEDDDWGTGSFDIIEAVEKALAFGTSNAYIAVIADGKDPVLEDTFEIDLNWEVDPIYAGDNQQIHIGDVLASPEGYFEVTDIDENGRWVCTREQIPTDDHRGWKTGEELMMTARDAKNYRHA